MTQEEFLKKWSAVVYEPEPICGNRYAMEPDLKALLEAEGERLMRVNRIFREELAKIVEWLLAQDSVEAKNMRRNIRETLWSTATPEERRKPFAVSECSPGRCVCGGCVM